ncbi:MAG: type II toxin-antitoxin system Phd/YefM family antitoxin [Rhizobiales bacterium]|nr:type II toxin-antitoxin system Phd/YefM family antitoxin [Hyphomicrobiales bacterium]
MTVMTSRAFNHDTGRAKRAAKDGPVFITDRGRPAHVLLSIEEYNRLAGKGRSLLEALAQPGGPEYDFDFEPPKLDNMGFKPADFD